MTPLAEGLLSAWTQSPPPDTVFVLAPAETLDLWADVATVALAVLILALVVLATATAVQFRRLVVDSSRALSDLKHQLKPVTERSQVVAQNLGYISAVIREDVERLSSTVSGLTERLNQASDRVEERIEEFNALLEVAQSEAEGLFIDTASAVRGVQAGARSLGGGHPAPDPSVDPEGGP